MWTLYPKLEDGGINHLSWNCSSLEPARTKAVTVFGDRRRRDEEDDTRQAQAPRAPCVLFEGPLRICEQTSWGVDTENAGAGPKKVRKMNIVWYYDIHGYGRLIKIFAEDSEDDEEY